MSAAGGSNADTRIQALEKDRKQKQSDIERRRDSISASTAAVISNAATSNNFSAPSGTVDDLLTTDTVGLVTHNDFKARRQYLERCATFEIEKRRASRALSTDREKLLKRQRTNKSVLSFQTDSEDDDESGDDGGNDDHIDNGTDLTTGYNSSMPPKRRRLGKDPSVDAKFLPDRDRETAEKLERERLKNDWMEQQEIIKNEAIRVTYSYWDGAGHRRVLSCKKGTTIGRFLAMVQTEFKQLRNTAADDLMFIKEDVIIPHHYSFYDFVIMKARGKSGPLFSFDVVEDVRAVADASKEKEDAHAGKVVERRWYERNRHIFPASRWEVYDPTRKYTRYTIHGA